MASHALRGRAAHRARLSVETLESRDGPSSLTGLNGGDLITQLPGTPGVPLPAPGGPALPPVAAPGQNRPPVISNFRASVGPNGQVTFTGTVSDDQAVAGLVVTVTGTGFAATAVVDSDGTFRVTTMVFGSGEMTATATVTDALGATSDPARTTFTPMP